MNIVEVGFLLKEDLSYYDNLLKNHGLINDYNVITHDIYYTNRDLDGISENEMKNACIRLRSTNHGDYKVQNNLISGIDKTIVSQDELMKFEEELSKYGYKKVFDTTKKDHQYVKDGMNSKIQLQEIDDIGLLVYYDNSLYYNLPIEEQRNKLIDELNIYGFNFKYDDLGLDKLRTLYYGENKYSMNQNS